MALGTLGRSGMIWWQAIAARPRLRNAPLVIKQIYQLGVLSL
ncbi:MAG: ABC transporter permease, partial [Gammaproteobacteria bacterium]|nr:ABC transporter permease [Gammaproteobacteria bacterium]